MYHNVPGYCSGALLPRNKNCPFVWLFRTLYLLPEGRGLKRLLPGWDGWDRIFFALFNAPWMCGAPPSLSAVHQKAPNPIAGEGWEVKVCELPDLNVGQDGVECQTEINKKCANITVSPHGSQQQGWRLHQLFTYFPCRQTDAGQSSEEGLEMVQNYPLKTLHDHCGQCH